MTLLEKISQLRLKALAADDEEKIKSRSGDFTSLRERLQNAAANAANVADGRKELQAAGVAQDDYHQERIFALATVTELIHTISTLPVEAKFDAVKMQGNAIEMHFKNSEKSVAGAWKAYLPNSIPAADDDLLNALEQAGVDLEAIRSDIESARLVLLTLCNRLLPQPGDIAKLQQALSTLSSSKSRIGDVIDPLIANVVVRAQDGGVPYSEMTPEVISALEELHILDRFRVVLK